MLSIGDFARMGAVSVRTLHFYEEMGLLVPASTDPVNGYRKYEAAQLARLHRIVALTDLGLSLRDIAPLLDDLSLEQLEGMLKLKRAELVERIAADEKRLDRVERRLRYIEQEDVMTDIVSKDIPELRIAYIEGPNRAVTFYEVGEFLEPASLRLHRFLKGAGVQRVGPMFSFYEDRKDEFVVPSVGVGVGDQIVPEDDEIEVKVLPPIKAATAVYQGLPDHGLIGPVYGQLGRWADDHGFDPCGPGRDLFIQGKPDEYGNCIFELQLPIVPRDVYRSLSIRSTG